MVTFERFFTFCDTLKKREELDLRYKKYVLADRKELLTVPS
jgi:hypothetical protein